MDVYRAVFQFLGQAQNLAVAIVDESFASLVARLFVHLDHDVLCEVEDPFQVAGRQVQQQSKPGRSALGEPDVGNRGRKLDVPHPLATHLRTRDLNPAAVADHTLVADLLVLTAVAFPVLRGTENALAKQAVLLGPQRAVVDGFGLGNFAVGPCPYLLR